MFYSFHDLVVEIEVDFYCAALDYLLDATFAGESFVAVGVGFQHLDELM